MFIAYAPLGIPVSCIDQAALEKEGLGCPHIIRKARISHGIGGFFESEEPAATGCPTARSHSKLLSSGADGNPQSASTSPGSSDLAHAAAMGHEESLNKRDSQGQEAGCTQGPCPQKSYSRTSRRVRQRLSTAPHERAVPCEKAANLTCTSRPASPTSQANGSPTYHGAAASEICHNDKTAARASFAAQTFPPASGQRPQKSSDLQLLVDRADKLRQEMHQSLRLHAQQKAQSENIQGGAPYSAAAASPATRAGWMPQELT